MHRTGIELGPRLRPLRQQIESSPALRYAGLHVYDGHLHDPSLTHRQSQVESILATVQAYDELHSSPRIVVGGSPTFDLWAHQSHWQCSPGTPLFWDVGYGTKFPELPFSIALALVTRVISKPGVNRVCLDLGYKAIAAEMPLELRVTLPSIPDAVLMGHSEEHLVIETSLADELPLGHALLAFPRHVCPTVALHDFATVIRSGCVTEERWTVDARGR
jgi:D-serine deaminase-like pyridoxal phosphate-dependent protein